MEITKKQLIKEANKDVEYIKFLHKILIEYHKEIVEIKEKELEEIEFKQEEYIMFGDLEGLNNLYEIKLNRRLNFLNYNIGVYNKIAKDILDIKQETSTN